MMASKSPQTVLVTGASGYIGSAVARSFVKAGWSVFGLVRRVEAFSELESQGVVPLLGSPDELTWLPQLYEKAPALAVIVSATENIADYVPHFHNIVTMLRTISDESSANGLRPLVLFTSGCKDYGRTALAGAPDLQPSTEDSPLAPPPLAVGRATNAVRIFEHSDSSDAILLRPTTVYGLTSSYYATAFDLAAAAQREDGILRIPARPDSIMHGCHVDDCGDAYVSLAEHPDRSAVIGHTFNISASRFETAKEVADALATEYGLKGVVYQPEPGTEDTKLANFLFAFSQWVRSDKLRTVTGWSDRRPLFANGIKQYRQEYELARSQGDYAVLRTEKMLTQEHGGKVASNA